MKIKLTDETREVMEAFSARLQKIIDAGGDFVEEEVRSGCPDHRQKLKDMQSPAIEVVTDAIGKNTKDIQILTEHVHTLQAKVDSLEKANLINVDTITSLSQQIASLEARPIVYPIYIDPITHPHPLQTHITWHGHSGHSS